VASGTFTGAVRAVGFVHELPVASPRAFFDPRASYRVLGRSRGRSGCFFRRRAPIRSWRLRRSTFRPADWYFNRETAGPSLVSRVTRLAAYSSFTTTGSRSRGVYIRCRLQTRTRMRSTVLIRGSLRSIRDSELSRPAHRGIELAPHAAACCAGALPQLRVPSAAQAGLGRAPRGPAGYAHRRARVPVDA
jgi:hypothetical protein